MFKEFREFIARGNVVDLAIGVMIGAAFGKIVTSLVEGVLMPPIGVALGPVDFSNLFYVLDKSKGIPTSLADAKARSVPVIAYGQFFNDIITFLVIALVLFFVVRAVNRMWSKQNAASGEPTTKTCPFCLSTIPLKATRCKDCTIDLQAA